MKRKRDLWVDKIKIFACVLVVIGHFFQSMVAGGIIPGNMVYQWFIETIYYFHVPLFFICSGYLYQRGSPVNTFAAWKINVLKKFVALGIPYFTFSLITWALKIVFASSVNKEADGLLISLFEKPMSPYWYLYTLFFIFLMIPTFSGKKGALTGLGAALVCRVFGACLGEMGIFAVSSVMQYGIWFVLGMNICVFDICDRICRFKHSSAVGTSMTVLFLTLTVIFSNSEVPAAGIELLMGFVACTAVLVSAVSPAHGRQEGNVLAWLSQYTMPIFLMHTIFAAGLRSVLLKIGVHSAAVHIVCGLLISFAGPVAAAEIMRRVKWMEFILYPGKYIRLGVK